MIGLALALCLALSQTQAVQPPRDTPPPADSGGTAIVRGRVVAPDTGQPIPRVEVVLIQIPALFDAGGPAAGGNAPSVSRRATRSGRDGSFEFVRVPAGSYRLQFYPSQADGQFLPLTYGAARSATAWTLDQGKAIELARGQIFDAGATALPRGAALAGRVLDEAGAPLVGVSVRAVIFIGGQTRGVRWGDSAQTDDLGRFRIFGLPPADYAVVAELRVPPAIGAGPGSDDPAGGGAAYLTTYYPSTPYEAAAERVEAAAGREVPGLEIRVLSARMYRVAGQVIDSRGRPIERAMGRLVRRDASAVPFTAMFVTDQQGRFEIGGVLPGDYQVSVRQRAEDPQEDDPSPDPGELATQTLAVDGDVRGLTVLTAPAVTTAGRVAFEPANPELPGGRPLDLRVTTARGDAVNNPDLGALPFARVRRDGSFILKGLAGEYVLRVKGLPAAWYLKAATAGGADVLETPHAFTASDEIAVVISTRGAVLEGAVIDASGKPASTCRVVVFGQDKRAFAPNSLWLQTTNSGAEGLFRFTGLRPGAYYVAALADDYLQRNLASAEALFAHISRYATAATLAEGERRSLTLRLPPPR